MRNLKETRFIKKVINETDRQLKRDENLFVEDWALYEDYPHVGVEDVREDELTGDINLNVNVSPYFESKDAKGAAKAIISRIEEYARHDQEYDNDDYEEDYDEDYDEEYEEEDYDEDDLEEDDFEDDLDEEDDFEFDRD